MWLSVRIVNLLAVIPLLFATTAIQAHSQTLISRPLAQGTLALFSLKENQSTVVRLRTPEGVLKLRLQRVAISNFRLELIKPRTTKINLAPVRLFRGELMDKRGNAERWVAADIIGSRLRIWFVGPQRSRLYQLTQSKQSNSTKLRHLPSHYSVRCAAMSAQMPTTLAATSYVAKKIVELGLVIDYEYFSQYGNKTLAVALANINVANTIYRTQLGLHLKVAKIILFATPDQPLTSNSSSVLLVQLKNYLADRNLLQKVDLYHLVSKKHTNGGIIGLAFLAQACIDHGDFAVGLSSFASEIISPLVIAHEIGHGLGAQHPEEVLGNNIEPSLMSTFVEAGNSTFSDFSKAEIATYISDFGRCIRAK